MAETSLSLEIVTPEGLALREAVADLTAPSVEGEFGVLPGHQPLLAALRPGIVSFHPEGGGETRVAVGNGFVQVSKDRALVLTDRYATKAEIDAVKVRLELKEADEALDHYHGDPTASEYFELVERELWAAVRLELYGDPPPPTVRSFRELETKQGVVDEEASSSEPPSGAPH